MLNYNQGDENMKSKISLVILSVIIIFFIALSFYLGFEWLNSRENIKSLNTQIESLTKDKEDLQTQLASLKEKEEEDAEVKLAPLDLSKMKYNEEYWFPNFSLSYDYEDYAGVRVSLSEDNTINFLGSYEEYGKETKNINYSITGLDKKVVKVSTSMQYSSNRDAPPYIIVNYYFLMEDGTVRYISNEDIYNESRSLQTVEGLTDVVDIIKIQASMKYSGLRSYVTVALHSDGSSVLI